MSSITIAELNVAGLDLFMHTENYLDAVTDRELDSVNGGILPAVPAFFAASSAPCAAIALEAAKGAVAGIGIGIASAVYTNRK
ncbi:hypothetical protein H6G96_27385 [Nostoc sp. FACHB-892]|uniref:hypothetical protein n=1 Tax=Nostoc sp. FACHB-892 TaxID=2692843 RepID=UPI001683E8A4|nr:hypothetical protein [Nostoc sp. FACHB-892]MBD2729942.1 hypothetical protein [Nostoc sp. FACHB-892]